MKYTRLLILSAASFAFSGFAQDASVAVIELKPSANPASPLSFEKTELSVQAGQKVKLTLNNSGGVLPQPHNFLLLKPGKLDAVGALANAMLADPQGMAKSYIPEAAKPDIVANTKLVQPNNSETIEFTAPAEAGDYPYICTFPGHWMLMRGVMHVTK
jgi:azurin